MSKNNQKYPSDNHPCFVFTMILNYLVIATLTIWVAFTSCNKIDDDRKVQLLETMTYSIGNSIRYEYDSQNRISKLYVYTDGDLSSITTVSYSGQDLITLIHEDKDNPANNFTAKHIKNGNTISSYKNEKPSGAIFLNDEGYPFRIEGIVEDENGELTYIYTFQYQDGNVTKEYHTASLNGVESASNTEYKYDNKKSSLYHCKSPTWLFVDPLGSYSKQNNVIEQTSSILNVKIEYDYEYDDSGFPIKCTMTYKEILGGNDYSIIIDFKYKYY